MQIYPINFYNEYNKNITYKNKDNCQSNVTFTSFFDKFHHVVGETTQEKYIKSLKNFVNPDYLKLEGVQNGIEVFDGLSARQILSNLRDLLYIPIVRGCHNNCTHCYLSAQPHVVRASFEDFKSFIDGHRELNKRLQVDFAKKKLNRNEYVGLFYDSDGSDLFLRDKHGNIHEFPELNRMQYSVTGVPGLFDTAGWNVRNKSIQERMERFVQYYSDKENYSTEIHAINISVNPFHRIYAKSLEFGKTGEIEKSKKLRQIYVERMSNALFTFSPLFKNDRAHILARSFPDSQKGEMFDGVRKSDYKKLVSEIYSDFKKKLFQDYTGQQKYVKSNLDLLLIDDAVRRGLLHCDTHLEHLGRLLDSFKDLLVSFEMLDSNVLSNISDNKFMSFIKRSTFSMIDINGRVYRTNAFNSYKTDTCLNYKDMKNFEMDFWPKPDKRVIKYK